MNRYLSGELGDEHKSWKEGEFVIITTPTGSGKSTYVLHTLLAEALSQDKYLVYLCNRTSVYEQMKKDLDEMFITWTNEIGEVDAPRKLTYEEKQHMVIRTYQSCQTSEAFPEFTILPELPRMTLGEKILYKEELEHYKSIDISSTDVLYYIFDEAHYLLADSTFNTSTHYWFSKPLRQPYSVTIFLTATPDLLYCFLGARGSETDGLFARLYNSIEYKRSVENSAVLYENIMLSMEEINKSERKKTVKFHMEYIDYTIESKVEKTLEESDVLQPYAEVIDMISRVLEKTPKKECGIMHQSDHIYTHEADYSYIEPYYIKAPMDIVDEIINSKEKWVIFVNDLDEGISLESHLEACGCSATFVSSKGKYRKRAKVIEELKNLAESRAFSCKVLIATSVIDCGVSIHDNRLTNIVISQADKTSFLQMLGRIRIDEYKKVRLFITSITPTHIRHLRSLAIQTIRKYTSKIVHGKTEDDSISISEFLYSAYSFKCYSEALDEYREHDRDPISYLKTQLSWISKEYDPKRWYMQYKNFGTLGEYLKNMHQRTLNEGIMLEDIVEFRKQCLKLIMSLPEDKIPKNIRKDMGGYESGKKNPPGIKRFNGAFKELDLPYEIRSYQSNTEGRPTAWRIAIIDQ